MDERNQGAMLLRALKGAPLSVLVGLRVLGVMAGVAGLAEVTGYDRHAVGRALRVLEGHGLVERGARYDGWRLTSRAMQLPLWVPAELEEGAGEGLLLGAGEGANCALENADYSGEGAKCSLEYAGEAAGEGAKCSLAVDVAGEGAICSLEAGAGQDFEGAKCSLAVVVPGREGAICSLAGREGTKCSLGACRDGSRACSGGGLINSTIRANVKPPPHESESSNLARAPGRPEGARSALGPLTRAERELTDLLVQLTVCARPRAIQAVRTALLRGGREQVEGQIVAWSWYVLERGSNLVNPGYFVAGKLEEGEQCPLAPPAERLPGESEAGYAARRAAAEQAERRARYGG